MKKIIVICLLVLASTTTKEITKFNTFKIDYLKLPFSETNLRNYLRYLNLPDLTLTQAKLETGNFTSRIFHECNNLFGMHLPYIRKTKAIGSIAADNARVAVFDSWQSSVLDLKLYIEYWDSLGYNVKDFKNFLTKVGYCEKPTYVKDLEAFGK